ncbi:hypothetical protein [Streptomyces sp. NPDC001792]|uniref:hypothetical protein n=1 Tax=unclassified Streptomyces TaxID=2593676 RepID=UPI00331F5D1E
MPSTSGPMFTQSREKWEQSVHAGRLANRVRASAPTMVRCLLGGVAAIRRSDGQSHSDPSGWTKNSCAPPKQSVTLPLS